MTYLHKFSRTAAAVLALTISGTLAGCAQLGNKITDPQPHNEKVSVTETPKPTFSAKEVPLKANQDPGETVKDEGINAEWHLVAADSGPKGGTVFKVTLKNLSEDVALPPDAVNKVKLSIQGNPNVERLKSDDDGLDLPLGALATTTVMYTFNTSPWNLSGAKLQLANVEYSGNLNI